MHIIDDFLNRITMYRLVYLGLWVLAAVSIVCAFFQQLSFTALQLALSLFILVAAACISNAVFALFTKAAPTPESATITGLILFFIFSPMQSAHDGLLLALFAFIAIASKFLLAPGKKHLFNPAAFAAFLASVLGTGLATWWVGTPILFPFVLVVGLLFVRKTRRFHLLWSFLATAVIVFVARGLLSGSPIGPLLFQFVLSWPLIFFGTVMLTEPQTAPPTRTDRTIYGVIVGFLFSLAFNFGPISATPQLALLIGNIYSYLVSFRKRVVLTLKEIIPLTRDMVEFVLVPEPAFSFQAGQYAEWTLPHMKKDKRGIRRFFTLASAPEDPFIRLGMRVPVEGSSFKKALRALPAGARLTATGVAGEFVLPKDPNTKIAAIAGGIGITPFMSMFRQLNERGERRDISLIYAASSPLDFAYKKEIDSLAASIGLNVLYLPADFTELTTWTGKSGFLTDAMVRSDVSDFKDRIWYLSGPSAMVNNYKTLIRKMGISGKSIKTDYFPGL